MLSFLLCFRAFEGDVDMFTGMYKGKNTPSHAIFAKNVLLKKSGLKVSKYTL